MLYVLIYFSPVFHMSWHVICVKYMSDKDPCWNWTNKLSFAKTWKLNKEGGTPLTVVCWTYFSILYTFPKLSDSNDLLDVINRQNRDFSQREIFHTQDSLNRHLGGSQVQILKIWSNTSSVSHTHTINIPLKANNVANFCVFFLLFFSRIV